MVKPQVFTLTDTWPDDVILPDQTHSSNIIEVISGTEDLSSCDGIWTKNSNFTLGVKTADCAPICFWDDEKFGIIHAGWRGLAGGIIEKMIETFNNPDIHIWIGPLLPDFEIQRDDCYDQLYTKFGTDFFSESDDRITFHFQRAIQSIIPQAESDPRSTFTDPTLASWRRDHSPDRNLTVVGDL